MPLLCSSETSHLMRQMRPGVCAGSSARPSLCAGSLFSKQEPERSACKNQNQKKKIKIGVYTPRGFQMQAPAPACCAARVGFCTHPQRLWTMRVCVSVHPDWLYPLQTAPVSSLHVFNGSGSSPGLLEAEITESSSRRQVQSKEKRGIPRHRMLRALAACMHPEVMISGVVKGESDECLVGGQTSPLSQARSHFSQGQHGRKYHSTRVLLSL